MGSWLFFVGIILFMRNGPRLLRSKARRSAGCPRVLSWGSRSQTFDLPTLDSDRLPLWIFVLGCGAADSDIKHAVNNRTQEQARITALTSKGGSLPKLNTTPIRPSLTQIMTEGAVLRKIVRSALRQPNNSTPKATP